MRPRDRRRLARLGRSHLHLVRLVLMSQCKLLKHSGIRVLRQLVRSGVCWRVSSHWAVLALVTLPFRAAISKLNHLWDCMKYGSLGWSIISSDSHLGRRENKGHPVRLAVRAVRRVCYHAPQGTRRFSARAGAA